MTGFLALFCAGRLGISNEVITEFVSALFRFGIGYITVITLCNELAVGDTSCSAVRDVVGEAMTVCNNIISLV